MTVKLKALSAVFIFGLFVTSKVFGLEVDIITPKEIADYGRWSTQTTLSVACGFRVTAGPIPATRRWRL